MARGRNGQGKGSMASRHRCADRATRSAVFGWLLSVFIGLEVSIVTLLLPLNRGGDGSSPAETTGLQDEGTSRPPQFRGARRECVRGDALPAAVCDPCQAIVGATK